MAKDDQRIALCRSATMIAEDFLDELFRNQIKKEIGKKVIELLGCVSRQEIITFANFRNLKFEHRDNTHQMRKVLEQIESQYSGSTFGITKAKKILKKD